MNELSRYAKLCVSSQHGDQLLSLHNAYSLGVSIWFHFFRTDANPALEKLENLSRAVTHLYIPQTKPNSLTDGLDGKAQVKSRLFNLMYVMLREILW